MLFLDRSGEEIRRRTFVLNDPSGAELCLRPDLTIPVCRMHLQSNGKFPARLSYHGPALPRSAGPAGPPEPIPANRRRVSWRRRSKRPRAKCSISRSRACAPPALTISRCKIGDVALFAGLLDALDIPAQWRGRLKRHFWRPPIISASCSSASPTAPPFPGERYLARSGNARDAGAARDRALRPDGLSRQHALGGRTREEIVDAPDGAGAEAAAIRLDEKSVALIERVLSVSGPRAEKLAAIRALLKKNRRQARRSRWPRMESRIAALAKLGLSEKRVGFAARFGRNMEYYTGFVFELWSRDSEGPVQIAGGGRYDRCCRRSGRRETFPPSAAPSAASACLPRAARRERCDGRQRSSSPFPPRAACRNRSTHYLADAGLALKQVTARAITAPP